MQAQREHALLCQVLGREPRLDELAIHLGRPEREVAEALGAVAGRRPESLDALYEGQDLHERLPAAPGDGFAALDDSMLLGSALQQLDAEEKQMLRLRYFEDRSQQDIGTRMRMTQMQVSRALSRILTKLHRHMGGHCPTATGHETRAA